MRSSVPSRLAVVRHRITRHVPPPVRLLQFVVGLALCAVAVWASIRVGLGVSPWDTLHVGLSVRLGLSFGVVVGGVGLLVLTVSWALGVRPGWGTLLNLVAVAWVLDALLATPWLDGLPDAPMAVRVLVLGASVVLLGVGGALYIGAGLGAGPRDSLMVACYRHGLPIGASRCVIELSVLLGGWLLGGPVGVGTLVLALGTGPVVQVAFRVLRQEPAARRAASSDVAAHGNRPGRRGHSTEPAPPSSRSGGTSSP
jgi:uncharacterized protein